MLISPYDQPWSTNYQRQQADAMDRALSMSDAQLRALGPPLPQIRYLPPRFGYPTYVERQWTVMQVFGITRKMPAGLPMKPQMRVDYTRDQATAQGSERNSNSGDPMGLGGVSW